MPASALAILVLPVDLPAEQANAYQTLIYNLAQANSMRFQVLNSLTQDDMQREAPALKIVVALPPDPGLEALVSANPAVQFLAIGIPALTPAVNLSTIGAEGAPVDRQAFLAGYIAAMITQDYRVGILTSNDASGLIAERAFINGMHFYCGLCQKAFGPWYDYPIHVEIPTEEPASRYAPYSDAFKMWEAPTVYVYPGIANVELLEHMAYLDLYMIGEEMLMQDLAANWVVSLKPDFTPAIQALFADLVAGRGGQTIGAPLILGNVNSELLTEGKLRLVQETLDELQAGRINTGVNP
jgi:hypothetical protein